MLSSQPMRDDNFCMANQSEAAAVLYEMANEIAHQGGIKYARVAVQYGTAGDADRMWVFVADQIAAKLRDRAAELARQTS